MEITILISGFIVCLMMGILVWSYYIRVTRAEKLQEQELDQYVTEVESIYRNMRAIRHDYRNHLQVIEAQLQMNEVEMVLSYVQQLHNELNQVDTIIRTGNIMIDTIVNTKLTPARNQGIDIHATAIAPATLPIEKVDLTIMLGNLLTNAVEAVTYREQASAVVADPFIRLYIAPMKDTLYINVTNASYVNPQLHFMSLKRVNRQGHGIRRIDKVVAKYNGIVNRQWEDGVFATEITIPLIDEESLS